MKKERALPAVFLLISIAAISMAAISMTAPAGPVSE